MSEWYNEAFFDIENNELFIEKLSYDAEDENKMHTSHKSEMKSKKRSRHDSAWVKKRNYKKRLYRRFLSMNPAMEIRKTGISSCPAIYININFLGHAEHEFFDARLNYSLNPYEKLFISRRGDIRKYYGNVGYVHRSGSFCLANKDKFVSKLTNKRIRHEKIEEESPNASFSYYKKMYGPFPDGLW